MLARAPPPSAAATRAILGAPFVTRTRTPVFFSMSETQQKCAIKRTRAPACME